MKKLLFSTIFIAITLGLSAQKYITKNGHIGFYSSTPLENIVADNNQVASVLDISTKEMVFQALMKSFIFERALMQEHFNENYVESEKFPKAVFKGKIVVPDNIDLTKKGKYDVTVEGDLTLHGVTKNIKEPGQIVVGDKEITAQSEFLLKPEDFDITIPGVVRDKIAKEMQVKVDVKYLPMN